MPKVPTPTLNPNIAGEVAGVPVAGTPNAPVSPARPDVTNTDMDTANPREVLVNVGTQPDAVRGPGRMPEDPRPSDPPSRQDIDLGPPMVRDQPRVVEAPVDPAKVAKDERKAKRDELRDNSPKELEEFGFALGDHVMVYLRDRAGVMLEGILVGVAKSSGNLFALRLDERRTINWSAIAHVQVANAPTLADAQTPQPAVPASLVKPE